LSSFKRVSMSFTVLSTNSVKVKLLI
jgi:hypothetical protein